MTSMRILLLLRYYTDLSHVIKISNEKLKICNFEPLLLFVVVLGCIFLLLIFIYAAL